MNWITEKPNKVIAKIRNRDGSLKSSVVIPTDYYPLNKNEYKIFHSGNTAEVTDENVLKLIDKVTYKIGHCYHNADEVANILKQNGHNVKTYVGWLFIGEHQLPVHHCWVVLNENQIVDLTDDFTMMFGRWNGKCFREKSLTEARELLVDFSKWSKGLRNSERCFPVGTPTDGFYYVGTECAPIEGIKLYQELIRKYPNHECQRNCDNKGYNKTQRMLKDNGLMD